MATRFRVRSEQEEAPLAFLVLQAGRDSCLLSPHNHSSVQLPLRGFGCLYLERRPGPVASAWDFPGPALSLVFPLGPPAQEELCAVGIDFGGCAFTDSA